MTSLERDRAAQERTAQALADHVRSLKHDSEAQDAALRQLAEQGMPALVDRLHSSNGSILDLEVPPHIADSDFTYWLGRLMEEFADALRGVESEAGRAAATAAEETTAAAVITVATGLVSLTAGVSQHVGEALERHTGEKVYETLSVLDHRVQQVLRIVQNYLVMFGGPSGRSWPAQPLTEVVRGAQGRVVGFQRVRIQAMDFVVVGRAVEPAVHALANLLDNALRFSPPTAFVDVSFQVGQHGVSILVDDAGLRMNDEEIERANRTLAGHLQVNPHALGPNPQLGFHVVARLCQKYGFHAAVQAPNHFGGTRAVLHLPFGVVNPPASAAPAEVPAEAAPQQARVQTNGGLPRRQRRSPAVAMTAGSGLSDHAPNTDHLTAWMTASANDPVGGDR
ncbi:ATP-binding protein [Kitasatospora aureofaciens]|uniref:ATP-binding protein n=1 Tax=Kitasatospora aureofaciens TaxID=1894 RepID=UPI00131B4AD0|nr:ATP-binding protein [Kitasatospora aureofaciens]